MIKNEKTMYNIVIIFGLIFALSIFNFFKNDDDFNKNLVEIINIKEKYDTSINNENKEAIKKIISEKSKILQSSLMEKNYSLLLVFIIGFINIINMLVFLENKIKIKEEIK